MRREIKPRIKQELVDGILKFWETVDVEKCTQYTIRSTCTPDTMYKTFKESPTPSHRTERRGYRILVNFSPCSIPYYVSGFITICNILSSMRLFQSEMNLIKLINDYNKE